MPSVLFFFRHHPAAFALALCFSLGFSSLASGGGGGSPPNLLVFPAAMGAANASGQSLSPGSGGNTTLVQFDATAVLALPIGGEAAITLPRLGTLTVVHDRQEQHPNGDVTWVGYFKGWGDNYRVVITTGPNGTAGRIVSPDGEFSLLPGGSGGAWLRDNSQAGLQPVMQDSDDTVPVPTTASASSVPPGLAEMAAMAPATASGQPTAAAVPATDPNAQATIDLMIVYTAGMVQRYGNGLQTRLNNLVAIANQAYIDSGIHITLRLVYTVEVDYSETTSISTAWLDLSSGSGLFANIPALRTQYGADLVQMIRPYNSSVGVCGLAGQSIPASSTGFYSVSEDGYDMKGGYANCNDIALTHELGHSMGAAHDRAHALSPGIYDYSYGYGITGQFADIMSTGYVSAPGVAKFSDPNLICDANNDPCGIAPGQPNAADNVLTLNNTRFAVAALMPSAAPPTATLTATPSTVAYGGSSSLAWSSTNATSCSAVSSDGQSYSAIPTAGNATVAPPATITYTLTCAGPGGTVSAAATVTVSLDAVACLFNWGEKNYPALFAPTGASLQAWSVYTYRHYTGTNSYLGVSSADKHVYYLGPDGFMQDEGALSHWLPIAGCQ